MKSYRLDGMRETAIAVDLETKLIQPGLLSPPMVLGSMAELHGRVVGTILTKGSVRWLFQQILDNPQVVLCGANIAFDLLVLAVDFARRGIDVMDQIFDMYDPEMSIVRGDCDGRVFEIQLAEPLHAIAQGHHGKHALTREPLMNKATGRQGRYSLDNVTFEVLGREDAKTNDRFRMSYAQFDDVPLEQLPFEATQYPIDDAKNTVECALAQAGHLPSVNVHDWVPWEFGGGLICNHCETPLTPDAPQACMRRARRRNLHNLANQAYFAWAAHLGAAWGFHVPQDAVDELEARVDAARELAVVPFKAAGIVRENGSANESVLKRLVAIAYGARDLCPTCNGTGKVPSERTNGKTKVNCKACDGCALSLTPDVPRTASGEIACGRDPLCESGDELLMEYGEQPSKKIKTTYIPLLRRGRACVECGKTGVATKYTKAHEDWCTQPGTYRPIPLIARVNALVETGRSSVEDGLHGLPRKGGVRECIRARPGFVLSSSDYAAGELVTLAWACLKLVGRSRLADALNHKLDAHLALAGTMIGKPYDEMLRLKKAHDPIASDNRQAAKAANFGFPGGMAELTFVLRKRSDPELFTPCPAGPDEDKKGVRGYKGMRPCVLMDGMDRCGYVKITSYNDTPCQPVCKRCVEAAKRLRSFWFEQWPEMNPKDGYFKKIKELVAQTGPSGTPEIAHLGSLRVRGGVAFTDGANGLFQGRLADAAKAAFCQIQRECVVRTRVRSSEMMTSRFDGTESPLYGSRAILMYHDETIAEHPASVASEAAMRVSECMVEALRFACPELREAVVADPCLMLQLLKGAEARWERGGKSPADEYDRLVPYIAED